jgi:hypothetical protein
LNFIPQPIFNFVKDFAELLRLLRSYSGLFLFFFTSLFKKNLFFNSEQLAPQAGTPVAAQITSAVLDLLSLEPRPVIITDGCAALMNITSALQHREENPFDECFNQVRRQKGNRREEQREGGGGTRDEEGRGGGTRDEKKILR